MADFFIAFTLDTPRGATGGLIDMKNRLKGVERTIGQVYRIGGKRFLETAAENLETIPSGRRYRAWHSGRRSTSPFRSGRSLAQFIVNKRNMTIEDNSTSAAVRIFDFNWMDSVAPHWSAIEFGSDQNVINAFDWKIGFRHPGDSAIHAPGGAPVGKLVKIGVLGRTGPKKSRAPGGPSRKIIKYAGGAGGSGGVQEPIRPGYYLRRSYDATIKGKLENELRSRIRASLGHVAL